MILGIRSAVAAAAWDLAGQYGGTHRAAKTLAAAAVLTFLIFDAVHGVQSDTR